MEDRPNRPGLTMTSDHDVLESIAIVGFSIRFPGDADSAESFWKLMSEKRCTSSKFPRNRVNVDAFYHPDSAQLDSVPMHNAHFLDGDLGAFDAPFFSITPSEALSMDPQHRGLLETAYLALENAGIPLHKVDGTNAGVFTGSFGDDYRIGMLKDVACMPKHAATGLGQNFSANRLSWAFNLKGPSLQIDTACSSSLIALDTACQSLRNRDSTTALVCGSNVISSIESFMTLSNMGLLSPDGKCYSFDSRGNGYARGEGFGVLVIKLLSDAIRDGDNIRAVVRASGSNQNGRTRSITQTSKADQIELMKHTYEKAGLDFRANRFVEAHGTGTALGDPTEASAIGEVFGKCRDAEDAVYVGAVKSNVGHLEGASGIAGIVKAVLVLEKGIIPPNTNFERLNPKIKANTLNLRFPTTSVPWPVSGLRRASVNAFGFGGSNAHIVLDDAFNYMRDRGLQGNHCTVESPPYIGTCLTGLDKSSDMVNGSLSMNGRRLTNGYHTANGDSRSRPNGVVNGSRSSNGNTEGSLSRSRRRLLLFSATNETSVKRLITAYSSHFQTSPSDHLCQDTYLDNLAYTLSDRRTRLPCRSFAVFKHASDLSDLAKLVTKPTRSSSKLGLCFVFSGQGAQYSGMGKELIMYPAFKKTLVRAESILRSLGCDWSIIDELLRDETTTQVHSPEFSQPLCTIVQVALVELLRTCGVRPSVVVGHSSGEIAAAYAAGALSIVSACKAAYYRGKFSASLSKSALHNGAMLAVGLSKTDAHGYMNRIKGVKDIVVACINSPKSVTISGDEESVDTLKSLLDSESIFNRKLKVDVAYHSSHMEEIAPHYADSLQVLEKGDRSQYDAVMVSSVTGEPVLAEILSAKQYWVQNLVSPVRFSEAFAYIASKSNGSQKSGQDGLPPVQHILEVGPHSTLQGPIRDILAQIPKGTDMSYFSSLKRNESGIDSLLNLTGELWSRGYELDILPLNQPEESSVSSLKTLTDLPQYPFDHSNSFFHLPRYQKDFLLREFPTLDLLGTPVLGWNPLEPTWRKILGVKDSSWIEDHVVNGTILYPAAGMLVMAIEAARLMAPPDRKLEGILIKEATFGHSLPIPSDETGVETRLHLKPLVSNIERRPEAFEFSLYSISSEQWVRNCHGSLYLEFEQDDTIQKAVAPSLYCPERLFDQSIEKDDLYRNFRKAGLEYGPAFQALLYASYTSENFAYSKVDIFPNDEHDTDIPQQDHVIHPVTLDALAQVALVALTEGGSVFKSTNVPTAVRDLWISGKGVSRKHRSTIGAYAKTLFRGDHQNDFSVTAVDDISGEILVSMSRLETTNVGNVTQHLESQDRQQCYVVDVKPDIDLLNRGEAQEYCLAGSGTITADATYSNDLDIYMCGMFRKIVGELKETDVDISHTHYQRYYDWARDRVFAFEKAASPEQLRATTDIVFLESARRRIEAAGYEGKFYSEVGRNLLDILRGKVDPLAVLFEGGLARDLYHELNTRISQPLTRLMKLLSHKNPNMKIIEIGAGTGGTSEVVLKALEYRQRDGTMDSQFSSFDYTDLSASFFEGAKDLFRQYASKMAFKVLDVESEPFSQGVGDGTYDMVLAANVLHATRSLGTTLQNVRSLLKPGGKLVLVEVTNQFHKAGFGMGLLPGWWLSTDDFRVDGPCISKDSWDEVLRQTGFSGVDLSLSDHKDDHHHELSILVATAMEFESVVQNQLDICILVDDTSVNQKELAKAIQNIRGETTEKSCSVVYLGDAMPGSLGEKIVISLLEIESPILNHFNLQHFLYVQYILTQAAAVLWVNAGDMAESNPVFKMVDGLRRVLTSENSDLVFVTLALGEVPGLGSFEDCAELVLRVYQKIMSRPVDEIEEEYIRKGKTVYIKRLVEAQSLNHHIDERTRSMQASDREFGRGLPLRLDFECPGVIDSLRFVEDRQCEDHLEMGEVEIAVKACGLIFRDCLVALNRLKASSSSIGTEFSGTVIRTGQGCTCDVGDAVYGLTTLGSFGSIVRTSSALVTSVPDGVSFLDAAGLPIAFGTAYHGLVEIARLDKGETVLIHSAAGGTGQAAIQVAQHLGAEIYATVGTLKKKQLLMDRYKIPEERIFSSRSTKFSQQIKNLTNGEGVDVILNSLSGEKLTASWECIASFGRFIEIGKRDIMINSKLPMLPFLKNVSFCVVDLFGMIQERPRKVKTILERVNNLLKGRHISSPYPLTVYGVGRLEEAFRDMQSGLNCGKIVVEMRKTEVVKAMLPVRPSWYFDPNASYLIAGGFGGVARSIARWMVGRGAKHLILLSRSGPKPGKSAELVQELVKKGVRVEAPCCDVSCTDKLNKALQHCQAAGMPSIKGCIQGSMVLRDTIFANMKWEDWDAVQQPRVQGTFNLHRHLPRGMDFFVMLSSVAGVAGTPGQANYAATNSFLDAFARYRIMKGEKATSIDLGWVGSEGTIAENQGLQRFWTSVGCWIPVSQPELFCMLDYYCDPAIDNLTAETCQAVIGISTPSMMRSKGYTELPTFLNRPMFSFLHRINASSHLDSASFHSTDTGTMVSDYVTLYKNAASAEEAVENITAALVQRIAKAMAIPAEDIDPRRPLHTYGVDSLLAIELRTWFKKFFGIEITVFDILGAKNFALLGEMAVQLGGRFNEGGVGH